MNSDYCVRVGIKELSHTDLIQSSVRVASKLIDRKGGELRFCLRLSCYVCWVSWCRLLLDER
jgi:hypothetical protein